MIDTVAKALARWAVPVSDWDGMAESQREAWRAAARVAIETMREPTDEMCEAGYSAGTGDWGGKYDNRRELACGRTTPGWRAMIDAALTPADG